MSKKLFVFAVLWACLPLSAALAEDTADEAELTSAEWSELITLLDESHDMLMGLISGLSEEQWTFKQNPDRWSVGECAEHIVRSERGLLEEAKTALANPPDPDWQEKTKGKTQFIRQIMPNRQPMGRGGATAPQEIRPTEKWSRAKVIEEFYKVRGEVRALVETLDGPVKNHTTEHPFPVFGWLTAQDWLIYVPLHTIRHSKQIIEVQEDPNYPKE